MFSSSDAPTEEWRTGEGIRRFAAASQHVLTPVGQRAVVGPKPAFISDRAC